MVGQPLEPRVADALDAIRWLGPIPGLEAHAVRRTRIH